ncbi:putative NARF family protein [Lyophyllum shimeji]|uniref:NARF family protein n=1 Tax=Lyophyllum shimeji TaxID=47721 RepID=A0A9P3PKI5_LYOSH|nr:putative NARF family protein [Lyophyllum shimeji]
MAFSGALTLTDLNDFITPSQACIKPVQQSNKPEEKDPGAAATEIQIDRSGAYYEVAQNGGPVQGGSAPAPKKLEQAQINLNDCLACSGCITSAESVLITLQSHTEVLNFLESNAKKLNQAPTVSDSGSTFEPYKIPVISISPQSLASLAAAVAASPSTSTSPPDHPSPRQILRRIRAFCTESLGFACVFDTTFARHLALQEHLAEFEERWRAAGGGGEGGDAAGGTGTAESAEGLPMLASSCPGWICYAEKAHAEMLPFISRTKSPQQVMGTVVKNWVGARWGISPDQIYHVTVMPCYDKKLEASRTDFYNDLYATRDVDCVITTGELELLMKEKSWDITQPVPGELDPADLPAGPGGTDEAFSNEHRSVQPSPVDRSESATRLPAIHFPELLTHPGTSSGSYLHAIITHLQDTSPVPLTLHVQTVRGADYEEFVLVKSVGQEEVEVFKGAKCYGFRNLQNIVRRVGRERGVRTTSGAAGRLGGRAGAGVARRLGKRAAAAAEGKEEKKERAYDYVEVMACPGGCVNGGGQLKPVIAAAGSVATPPPPPVMDPEGYKRDWEESGVALTPPPPRNGARPVDVTQNARWGTKEWTRKVEEEYWREPFTDQANRLADALAQRIREDLCGHGDDLERVESRKRFFRTEYHAVESDVNGLAVVW